MKRLKFVLILAVLGLLLTAYKFTYDVKENGIHSRLAFITERNAVGRFNAFDVAEEEIKDLEMFNFRNEKINYYDPIYIKTRKFIFLSGIKWRIAIIETYVEIGCDTGKLFAELFDTL